MRLLQRVQPGPRRRHGTDIAGVTSLADAQSRYGVELVASTTPRAPLSCEGARGRWSVILFSW